MPFACRCDARQSWGFQRDAGQCTGWCFELGMPRVFLWQQSCGIATWMSRSIPQRAHQVIVWLWTHGADDVSQVALLHECPPLARPRRKETSTVRCGTSAVFWAAQVAVRKHPDTTLGLTWSETLHSFVFATTFASELLAIFFWKRAMRRRVGKVTGVRGSKEFLCMSVCCATARECC